MINLKISFLGVRTIQHHMQVLKLHSRKEEYCTDAIINAVMAELGGISSNLGVGQIWRRLRREHESLVKRYFFLKKPTFSLEIMQNNVQNGIEK
jgi:hypothetical protein